MKFFTVEEANALLPRVTAMLRKLQEELGAHKFAEEQVQDLRAMWGSEARLLDPACPDHADYRRYVGEAEVHENHAKSLLAELGEMGVEVKDPWMGLVDFYARRGDDTVYLCWKLGESTIAHWHPLTTGFSGRRSVKEL